jgi:hypothetical protein
MEVKADELCHWWLVASFLFSCFRHLWNDENNLTHIAAPGINHCLDDLASKKRDTMPTTIERQRIQVVCQIGGDHMTNIKLKLNTDDGINAIGILQGDSRQRTRVALLLMVIIFLRLEHATSFYDQWVL